MPWWDSEYETPAAFEAAKAAPAGPSQSQMWDQYVQQAGGIGSVAPAGSAMDSQIRGGYLPQMEALPGGGVAMVQSHWDGGSSTKYAPDGRLVLDRLSEPSGHWDSPVQQSLGYTLRDTAPKQAADWGLKLTPTQQQQLGNKKLNRWENFDTAGKSQGYGYELYDDRGFFQQLIQDLGPVLMAPLMGALSPVVAGGIGSLTGFSPAVSQALGGGLMGGTVSALGGGDFLKGALAGGLGGAVSAYNPAGEMGVSGALQKPVNAAISGVGKAVLSGQGLDDALKAQLTNPSFLLSAASSASGADIGGWAGAVQLANAVKNGDPMAIMQAIKLVGGAQGKAAGGLMGEAGPDKVEASRILRDLPPDQARMLSGIAANF